MVPLTAVPQREITTSPTASLPRHDHHWVPPGVLDRPVPDGGHSLTPVPLKMIDTRLQTSQKLLDSSNTVFWICFGLHVLQLLGHVDLDKQLCSTENPVVQNVHRFPFYRSVLRSGEQNTKDE